MAANPIQSLMRFCAFRERAEFEVHQKAIKLGMLPADIKTAIHALKEEGFLNQERFLKAYIHDKREFQGWGPFKIMAQLRKFRIPASDITNAIETIPPETWENVVARLIQQKTKKTPDSWSYEEKAKLFKWLYSRGFTRDHLGAAFTHLQEVSEESEPINWDLESED